ncbi:hypothetical protein [Flavobacterium algicola]|uniref:hypothetical protein n=1 Tax=Flavobacterium algicola TaxID=556529 RepID=UPI001EFD3A42|nr:hypothetical protein [Flavobacterium algicola]MCG9793386.1 hypothetical protein [Flavobacterium algicola]
MATNKLKINLFGEVWKQKKLLLPLELLIKMEETAIRIKQPLTEVVVDPFFYHHLKSKSIASVEDLKGVASERLVNSPKNQIEIWYKNKKMTVFRIDDLNKELLLFPLYNSIIQHDTIPLESGIYIDQREIGLMGSFEIATDTFSYDNLKFQLIKRNEHLFLDNLLYNDQALICKRKDTLITFQNCFEVK